MRLHRVVFFCAAVGAIALVGALSSTPAVAVGFSPHVSYPAIDAPTAVVAGDFTGDGVVDLLVDEDVSLDLFTGRGDGTFNACQRVAGGITGKLATGDFNRDGNLDVAQTSDGLVDVCLGNGGGGFAGAYVGVGAGSCGITAGDLNADSNLDLVTANRLGDSVSVLFGDGTGSFPTRRDFATGTAPVAVAIADLNRDGKKDLVAANSSGSVSILLGDASGGFAARTDLSVASKPQSVAVGDLNGDGYPDIVTCGGQVKSDALSVLLSNGDGTFGAAMGYPPSYISGEYDVVIADIDGDGMQDLITAGLGGTTVLRGKGDGTFRAPIVFDTGSLPEGACAADLNGDGALDLAAACNGSETVDVLLQRPGTFSITPSITGPYYMRGTISPATQQSVEAGTTPTFAFSPVSGYRVSSVAVDGARVAMTGPNQYTFAPAATDHTISVAFEPVTAPNLTWVLVPRSVRADAVFSVIGTLRPRFPAGARTVTVKLYRHTGSGWRLWRTTSAVNADYRSYTRWSAKMSIARRGAYRFRFSTRATSDWLAARTGFTDTMLVK